MALFHGSADEAVAAAVGLQRALDAFNAEQDFTGGIDLRIGIGINSGPLMLGTIGGRERLDAGVIGDTVNLSARIEGMTRMYETVAILGQSTVERLAHPSRFRLRELDQVAAKGKTEPVAIFEVLDALPAEVASARWQSRHHYADGLTAYRAGDFASALAAFTRCVDSGQDDGPARFMADRCRALQQAPPTSWDGVTRLSRK